NTTLYSGSSVYLPGCPERTETGHPASGGDRLFSPTDMPLVVAGNTTRRVRPAYKQWLSLQCAQAVRDYLVELRRLQ
ncbi:MAG: hypothetical protein WBM52_12175, partial [Thiogranum sp.]